MESGASSQFRRIHESHSAKVRACEGSRFQAVKRPVGIRSREHIRPAIFPFLVASCAFLRPRTELLHAPQFYRHVFVLHGTVLALHRLRFLSPSGMSNKRLLFIQDDPLLGSIYRDRLEMAGFAVETARNGETGLRLVEEMRPDAVLVDPVLEATTDIGDSIARMRAARPEPQMPIFLLPTVHAPLANSAHKAGATRMIERSTNPLASIVAEVSKALGVGPDVSALEENGSSFFDSQWQQTALNAVPASLTALRQALHDVMRNPVAGPHWRELLRRVHTLAGQVALFGENPMAHLATALEVLVYGLECYPERINPLTLRTMGQATDFLVTLWEMEAHTQPLDLQQSQVLIVEDEAGARELIIAAMQMVGLNADGLETPGASLAVLSTHPCDLIFLDVNLPEMNGFEVCTKVRALSLHERTPIIFLTGMTSFHNRVQSSLSGGNDFVGKPFNVAELGVKALIWLLRGRFGLN